MTELDRRVEKLATHQHGLFTTRQVLLLQGTQRSVDHRVATGRWTRQQRGVLSLVGAPRTSRSRLMAAILALNNGAVVSHRSAASIFGIPGFRDDVQEVTVPAPGRGAKRPDITLHRSTCLPAKHLTVVDSLPITRLARVLLDLTAVVRIGRSARAIDHALARKRVNYVDLVGVLGDLQRRGRRRTAVFRQLLAERSGTYVPPASELERRFSELVESVQLGSWRRQVNLGNGEEWIGRVDFYRHDARLIVEVDGQSVHSSFLDRTADRDRATRLRAAGFRLLRFGWAEVVGRPQEVLQTLRTHLEAADFCTAAHTPMCVAVQKSTGESVTPSA